MALCTFDNGVNQGGTGDNAYEDNTNWFDGAKPANGDSIAIEADCICSTDESAAVLSVAHSDVDNNATLTMATGGVIYVQDVNFYVRAGAEIEFNGGTIRMIRTTGAVGILHVYGTITTTANGGTIQTETNGVASGGVSIAAGCSVSGFSSAVRLLIDSSVGAAGCRVIVSDRASLKHVEINSASECTGGLFSLCEDVVAYNCGSAFNTTYGYMILRDCAAYGNSTGVNVWTGVIDAYNCEFGVGGINTTSDVRNHADKGVLRTYNCKFDSTTLLANSEDGIRWTSTAHDQDPDAWLQYQGRGHSAEPEFGAGAQGGTGTAVKCISSANCAADEPSRFRRLVGVIPIDSASDTHIDATLYIKGTNLKTAVLRIDPDGIFGTTQAYNETADGNWNQRTIPQYTLSGAAIGKVCVPIYLDITGASETWYYDTLAYTLS